MRSERRVAFGIASVGAVLISAGGLAYLAAVSYRADRGIVAAKVDEHRRVARSAAAVIEGQVQGALDATVAVFAAEEGLPSEKALRELAAGSPLAARPFRIGIRGQLWVPDLAPLAQPVDPFLDLRERRPQPSGERAALLERARQAELGSCSPETGACQASPAQLRLARRLYLRLARSPETAPPALLALARLDRRAGDRAAAAARYRELRDRFGHDRDIDGISYALWADLGLAELRDTPAAFLALLAQVLERRYTAPETFLSVVAGELENRLEELDLAEAERGELTRLSARLARARAAYRSAVADAARAAATLGGDLTSIAETAGDLPRARPDASDFGRVLVYRRVESRAVVGIQLEPEMFKATAAELSRELGAVAEGAEIAVHPLGRPPAMSEPHRELATAAVGALLPNLAVSLIQPSRFPDPLDAIVRDRSQRHLLFSIALGALLIVGLVATIRGAARARELARLRSDFVSTVSHELKTPLTSIRMFAEMLQQDVAGSDSEREARYQDIIVKESERLGLLIANLLDYSQIERGVRRYSMAALDAGDLAADAIDTFRRLAEGENREVTLETGAGPLRVHADRESLIQSLLNLLGNAAKYSAPDQPIDVRVEAAGGDRVAISVTDRGPGVAKIEQRRIFNEFYRAPEARRSGVEGTGLGLALVKRHVEALGGDIRVESEPGQGATFVILLPRAVGDDATAGVIS
jgi:two-component system phosphate regulon sensor histidine kinase PhoR